jgi:hypothetical protein
MSVQVTKASPNETTINVSAKKSEIDYITIDDNGDVKFPLVPQCYFFIGKPKSGKSFAVKYMLYQYLKAKYFANGIIISPTARMSGDFDFMPDDCIWDKYNLEQILARVGKLEAYRKNNGNKLPPPSFIVFDDCLGNINHYHPDWQNFLIKYRHYNISLYFVSQYLGGFGSSTTLREMTTGAFIFNSIFETSLKTLYKGFGGVCENYKEFVALVHRVGTQKYHCVLYVANQNSKEDSYIDFVADETPKFAVKF